MLNRHVNMLKCVGDFILGQKKPLGMFFLSLICIPFLSSSSSSSACISKYSAGSIFYYPSFHYIHNPAQLEKFQRDLERYLSRKIGFEAVMRIRCTKGNRSQTEALFSGVKNPVEVAKTGEKDVFSCLYN